MTQAKTNGHGQSDSALLITKHLDSLHFEFSKITDENERLNFLHNNYILNTKISLPVKDNIAETIFSKANDSLSAHIIVEMLNYLGNYHRHSGNFARALYYLNLSQKINIQYNLAWREYINFGHLYAAIGDKESALDYYRKILAFAEDSFPSASPWKSNFRAYGELFVGHSMLPENPDSGMVLMHMAIKNFKNAGIEYREKGMIAFAYFKLANYAINHQQDYEKAFLLADTIAFWDLIEPMKRYYYARIKALCYYNRKQLDSALHYAQICSALTSKVDGAGNCQTLEFSLSKKLLSQIYDAKGQFKLALENLKVADSLENYFTRKENQNIVAYHRQQERDKHLELENGKRLESERQKRTLTTVGGLLFLLISGGLFSRLRYIQKSKAIIESERDRSDNLLLNILPEEIAQELKLNGRAQARDFEMVSILFTDFKGFTEYSAKLSAADLVSEINHCFEAFDGIIEKYGIEKIKTIGDAYMAAGGLPVPTNTSVENTVLAALEMQAFITKRKAENDAINKPAFEMRVGIHTGPVVAGIVGVKKFQYDIWGDTVNTASRMEGAGEASKVNISQTTYELLKSDTQFAFESRGKIEAKGKGTLDMYFVSLKA